MSLRNRSRYLPALALGSLAISLALVGPAPANAAPQPKDRTVQIERTFEDVIDLGENGNSHADLRITRGIVRSESGKRIGTYATSQTTVWSDLDGRLEERSLIMRVTIGANELTMVGMIIAPDAKGPSAKFVVPVVGGTGKYFGSNGTMTLIPLGNGVSTLKFDFA